MNTVPIPKRMRALRKDARGYPIPFIVLRDVDGKPHFTINDSRRQLRCLLERRCPICGGRLGKILWFVGGPRSAFDPNGAYLDSAMHEECMTYALQVCPYLAAPNYSGRIDAGTLGPDKLPGGTLLIDETMIPERPIVFVAVATSGQLIDPLPPHYITPVKPYLAVQYWRHGQRIQKESINDMSILQVK